MTLVGVVSLRWIARGARIGAPSVTLWLLAWLLFFLPLAAAVRDLSRRFPDQGGIYAWTRRAFGPTHGFLCGWCLWVNNLFYFPSLLLFASANLPLVLGARFAPLADDPLYSVVFVLVTLWLCTVLNVIGLRVSKWLQNGGGVATWIPAALLIACGVIALAWFGSATRFTPSTVVPREDALSTLGLWSAICFAFSGLEVTSLVGQEVQDPRRSIPRGVALAGALATLIYIGGSASLLVAVPASALHERSGIADAVDLVGMRIGIGGLGAVTGGLLVIGSIAMTSSWFAGAARVPFAAGLDRAMPAMFSRLHERYRTPHVALVTQAIASTAIFLVSVFFARGSETASIQEAYDILVNLTILVYFVPYLYLFLALFRLREPKAGPRGRTMRLALAAAAGLAATGISLCLVFVPPPGTRALNFELNLAGQALLIVGVGLVIYWRPRRRTQG
jgi:amino acid transporter